MSSKNNKENQNLFVRLDKWLWAARFYKTRSIARDMINSGKVHYNEQRTKPSKIVEVGAKIRLRQGYDIKIVTIENISCQRKDATHAVSLYAETQESIQQRENKSLERKLNTHNPRPEQKPDKKQRRDIIKFQHRNNN